MIERPPNKTCLQCDRKCIYPEKVFGDWFYPREQTCFDCLMIRCNRYDKIKSRKLPGKMNDRAELLFPLTVVDTSNNTKVGEYHNKQDVLATVDEYKQERKSSKDPHNPLSIILQLYRLFHRYKIVFKNAFFFSLLY
jgi:hypothetical protein